MQKFNASEQKFSPLHLFLLQTMSGVLHFTGSALHEGFHGCASEVFIGGFYKNTVVLLDSLFKTKSECFQSENQFFSESRPIDTHSGCQINTSELRVHWGKPDDLHLLLTVDDLTDFHHLLLHIEVDSQIRGQTQET